MQNLNVVAIIPARGGSKGVPRKNIRAVGGFPLIAYSIEAALRSTLIERVIVSTDSEEIAIIARQYGAEVPFLRPAKISTDLSTDLDFFLHAINWLKEHENFVPEFWVHLRPTTPLREMEVMDRAIGAFLKNKEIATSLRSAHPAAESPYKWFQMDVNGFCQSLSANLSCDAINNPRQEFSDVYIPDGYIDVVRTSTILNTGTLYGNRMMGFVSPVCCEVDREEDFQQLEYQLSQRMPEIHQLLSAKADKPQHIKRLRHVGLVVKDLARSLDFYQKFLGLTTVSSSIETGKYIDKLVGIDDVKVEWAKLNLGQGVLVELLQYHSHPDNEMKEGHYMANRHGCSHMALTVENLDQLYEKLVQIGVKCNSAPLLSPSGQVKVLYCFDPDGIIIELVEDLSK